MYAEIRGTRLYFDVEGASYQVEGRMVRQKPVCFVLHGGPGGTHAGYKPHLTPLTEYVQFVYIDNRGSGLSAKGPQETYTLENNVEDVEALRQYLGLEKIWILGQSYGGMVAMSYALKYQEHLHGLLLLTTSSSSQFLEEAKESLANKGSVEQKEIGEVLWQGSFQSKEELTKYYEVMAPLYYYQQPLKKKLPFPGDRSFEALNEGFGGFLRDYEITEELVEIQVPTLVLGARHDWITPVGHSEIIAGKIPTSEIVIFENSSHGVIQDEYEKFLTVVSRFLEKNNVLSDDAV